MREDRYRQRVAEHAMHGRYGAALATLDAWRAAMPAALEPELLHARIDLARGRVRAAGARAVAAIRERDCPPPLALDVVQCLRVLVEHDALMEWAQAYPHRAALDGADLARIAAALASIGAHALARDWVGEGVVRAPHDATCLVNRALLRSYVADFDGAAGDLERAIASPADPAIAHWLLARVSRQRPGEDHVERLRARFDGGDEADREFLAFALFKELDDLGDIAGAWAALEAGCRLVRSRMPYDRVAHENLFAAIERVFPLDSPPAAVRTDAAQPIFIVGMHRCGSTLLESMLAADDAVYGYGESQRLSGALRHAADHYCAGLLDEALVAAAPRLDHALVRDRFLDAGRRLVGGARFVTEKMPGLFQLVGFIRQALPAAKVIHVRRDPLDLCFANLRELFADSVPYAYSQEDVAHYHALYSRLMAHWRRTLPGFVLEVDYEDLVRDPLRTSRQVYAFCGLQWDPRVIDPAAWAGRAINTLSSVQARQPVNGASIGRWRPYAERLQPLRDALSLQARD